MNNKQQKLLEKILSPVCKTADWDKIEKLFISLGAEIEERADSRIAVRIKDKIAVFHRPHPEKEAKGALLKSIKQYLSHFNLETK